MGHSCEYVFNCMAYIHAGTSATLAQYPELMELDSCAEITASKTKCNKDTGEPK